MVPGPYCKNRGVLCHDLDIVRLVDLHDHYTRNERWTAASFRAGLCMFQMDLAY